MNSVKAFLSKWWPSLVLVAVVLFLALLPSGVAHSAVAQGDEFPARVFCNDEATIKAHANIIVEDKSYARVNGVLKEAIAAGVCVSAPYPIRVKAVRVVGSAEFEDSDGDNVLMQVLEVDVGASTGRTYWTIRVEVLKGT